MDPKRRARRRRRRIVAIVLFLVAAFSLAWFFESQATTTVIMVRYAELESRDQANPGLSDAGRRRAEELVRLMAEVDLVAGVDAIFATRFRYTQETAEPLAKQLSLPVQIVDMTDIRGVSERILRDYKGKIVLVITGGDAIAALIDELHGSRRVPEMGENEFDNLYIVSIPWYGKVKTLRLRYGAPYLP
jgi:broad specificity phosphatase PhoE